MNGVALVLYDENCKNEAEEFSDRHKSILGSFPISRVNTASLRKHWYSIVNYFSESFGKDNMPSEYMRILEDNEINALPLFFLEHHLSVIIPFLVASISRAYATCANFMAGVMPTMPMLGRSLL